MDERAQTICLKSNQSWGTWTSCPISDKLIKTWIAPGNLQPFLQSGALLDRDDKQTDVEAERLFNLQLGNAVRTFEAGQSKDLEILIALSDEIHLDPLWLQVADVKRNYLGFEFEGIC